MKWYEKLLQATLGRFYDRLFGDGDAPWVIGNPDYKFRWGFIEWLCVTLIGLFFITMVWIWLTK